MATVNSKVSALPRSLHLAMGLLAAVFWGVGMYQHFVLGHPMDRWDRLLFFFTLPFVSIGSFVDYFLQRKATKKSL